MAGTVTRYDSRIAHIVLHFIKGLAAAGIATAFIACEKPPTRSTVAMHLSPLPTTTPAYETYPISEAFSKGGRVLTPKQRAWIRRILHSRNYGKFRSRLRFADMAAFRTPIVVYVNRAEPGGGGHVIGEGCNVWFDPWLRGLYVGTGVLCSPPTPKPVE